jgi:hypothetical protein
MQEWEYLEVYIDDDEFTVVSSQGQYLTDEDYKSLDSKGQRNGQNNQLWKSGMGRTRFLLVLLNRLGTERWEAIGNINSGDFHDIFLLLKRPVSK